MSIEKQITNHMRSIGAVLVRSKNHNVWRLKNGRIVVTSCTPSDWRAFKNTLKDIRRAMAATV